MAWYAWEWDTTQSNLLILTATGIWSSSPLWPACGLSHNGNGTLCSSSLVLCGSSDLYSTRGVHVPDLKAKGWPLLSCSDKWKKDLFKWTPKPYDVQKRIRNYIPSASKKHRRKIHGPRFGFHDDGGSLCLCHPSCWGWGSSLLKKGIGKPQMKLFMILFNSDCKLTSSQIYILI